MNLDARPSTAFHIGSIRRKSDRQHTNREDRLISGEGGLRVYDEFVCLAVMIYQMMK